MKTDHDKWLWIVAACILFGTCVLSSAQEYQDLNEIYKQITNLVSASGNDASWDFLTDATGTDIITDGGPYSTNICLLTMAKGGGGADRKKVLVIGTQHAREWVAYRCVVDMAEFLIGRRNDESWPAHARFEHFTKFKEMNIKSLTDNADVYTVPLANPSGYAYSKANDFSGMGRLDGWRKNRRNTLGDQQPYPLPPLPGSRFFAQDDGETNGVDLCRNWPGSDWGDDETRFWPPDGVDKQIATSRYRQDILYCGRPRLKDG